MNEAIQRELSLSRFISRGDVCTVISFRLKLHLVSRTLNQHAISIRAWEKVGRLDLS